MAEANTFDIIEVDSAILPLVQHLRYRVYVTEMVSPAQIEMPDA